MGFRFVLKLMTLNDLERSKRIGSHRYYQAVIRRNVRVMLVLLTYVLGLLLYSYRFPAVYNLQK